MTIAPTSKTASPVLAVKAEKGHQIPTNIKNPNDSLRKRIKSLNQSGRLYTLNSSAIVLALPPRENPGLL